MNLDYAVDRLYEVGWTPSNNLDLEQLSDGRCYPTVAAVKQEFARAGLTLNIKHNSKFNCYRAAWAPDGEVAALDGHSTEDARHGTVVASCEREAAVYALAQLRAAEQQSVQTLPQLSLA